MQKAREFSAHYNWTCGQGNSKFDFEVELLNPVITLAFVVIPHFLLQNSGSKSVFFVAFLVLLADTRLQGQSNHS